MIFQPTQPEIPVVNDAAPFKILIVAAEALPFAKVGGLADVVGRLAAMLCRRGHDVCLVLPRYRGIERVTTGIQLRATGVAVPMGRLGSPVCSVLEGRLPGFEARVYFVDFPEYFDREGIYGQNGEGYGDNALRFAYLSRASLEVSRRIGFSPHIVHVHDWHTAMVPVFIDAMYRHEPLFASTASLLTIHNLEYQGRCGREMMDILGIGWNQWSELEFFGDVNLLKGGLYHATLLNTVSPTHAQEILLPEFGFGLEGVIEDRKTDLFGILNGLDEDHWDPQRDPFLVANFSPADWQGKAACKADLQRSFGLTVDEQIPVIGMVTRLVSQKGVDVLVRGMAELLNMDAQWFILGSGDAEIETALQELSRRYASRLVAVIGFDNALAHRIEAGADFFLMPSRHEPCGTNQMISMRYGAVPIVRATGGLNDTVIGIDENKEKATGIKFQGLSPEGLKSVLSLAVELFRDQPEEYRRLRDNGGRRRFSWDAAADAYENLYRLALARRTKVGPLEEKY